MEHIFYRRGNTFLNDEFVDEFGRLDLINATAIRSRAVSDDVITATLSVGELVDSAEAVETRARQLVESVGNITTVSPLTELGNLILLYAYQCNVCAILCISHFS